MEKTGFIGARIRRTEDPRLLSGQGRYSSDVGSPDMLHAAFVRSPYAHASIRSIDAGPASGVPGLVAVLLAADLPVLGKPMPIQLQNPDLQLRAPSPLAAGSVHFAGEAVVLVVADERRAAVDAAEIVQVDWEALDAVVEPEQALEDGAPRAHADMTDNSVGVVRIDSGDAVAAISSAAHRVRRTLSVERSYCGALEPRACVARPEGPDGARGLTLTTSTQAPHNHRPALSRIFELEIERIRVEAPDVGGGFGPKGRLYPEDVAVSAAALELGRVIGWEATRSEDFATTYQGRGTTIEAELAADPSGKLVALRARLTQDCGAYLAAGLMVPANSAQHMLGPYSIPNVSIEIEGVYTNKAPLTPLRGGGREVGAYVIERMMDHLAAEMEIDPVTLRERNALRRDEFPFDTGYPSRSGGTLVYDSGDFPRHIERARELIGYDAIVSSFDSSGPVDSNAASGHRKGVGLTLFIESTGFGGETARARLEPDGGIRLAVGAPSTGQGHGTVMGQIFAERSGVPLGDVRYQSGDTAVVEQGVGTFGSRIAVTAGNAASKAAVAFKQALLEAAEDFLEVSAADLELVSGEIRVAGYPSRKLSLGQFATSMAERGLSPVEVSEAYEGELGGAFAGGAHAAVVDVDLETGLVRVERYVVVHDCGTIINPTIVEGQVHGGVIHGIGNALGERMTYERETGQLLTGSFAAYQFPEINAAPLMEVIHHETPSPNNPEGIKGAGEGGTIGALATIARAVEDALSEFGIEVNHLPIEPEWIVRNVRAKLSGERLEVRLG